MERFRIMVVDDDPDVRFVVSSLLGSQFETVEAQNGLDALEKFDRSEPDLVLMDVSMPIMNGIACCQSIKRHPDFSELPVIFLSAVSDPQVRKQALMVGAVDYVEKPFETVALIETIQGYLQKSGVSPSTKTMTMERLKEIDKSPLQSAEEINRELFGVYDARPPSPEQQKEFDSGLTSGTRKRRVFGKKKEAPAEPPPSPQPEVPIHKTRELVELPTPPMPDYKAIARKRQEEEQRASQPETPKPPVRPEPPARPEPTPEPPPPKPEPTVARTPAPPSKEPEPSAREILARRRMSALRRSETNAPQSLKPRALVIVSDPRHLAIWNEALKGMAEFLPLEDPVEAIELIARFQPDLIAMGIMEQNFSGLQLAHMLRENPRLSHIELLFVQAQHNTPEHITAARGMSPNEPLRAPLTDVRCRKAAMDILSKPSFIVREKRLTYGVYVKEVLQAAAQERARTNKEREQQAYEDKNLSLKRFMAKELRDYKEPQVNVPPNPADQQVHIN